MSDSVQASGLFPAGPLCPWDSPGKNTGVGIDLPDPGIEPVSLKSSALASGFFAQYTRCPPPGDLPDPGVEPMSLKSPALARGFFTY